MLVGKFVKQPADVKDYVLDVSSWLNEVSDTLLDATVFIECTSRTDDAALTTLALKSLVINPASGVVAVWLERGTVNEKYKVTVRVTTAAGRLDESEFAIRMKDY